MTYQEKQNIVNMISGVLIMGIYSLIIYRKHMQGQFDLTADFTAWGRIFLVFMAVSIGARIAIYLIFHIINTIATRETDIPVSDERYKLIQLKGTRNGHYTFTLTFISAFILLATGMPVYGLFIVFAISSLLSEIVENSSQIYYHRKGVRNG